MLMMATRGGVIKKTPLEEFRNIRKGGLRAVNLREDDELVGVQLTDGDSEVLLATRMGQCVRFSESQVRPMGRTATGVRGVNLAEGDEVVSFVRVQKDAEVLIVSEKGYGKRCDSGEFPAHNRGGKGVRAMSVTEKTGLLCGMVFVRDDEDIMLINSDGTIIRMAASQVSRYSRTAQGVRLMRLEDDARVVSIAVAPSEEAEADEKTEE